MLYSPSSSPCPYRWDSVRQANPVRPVRAVPAGQPYAPAQVHHRSTPAERQWRGREGEGERERGTCGTSTVAGEERRGGEGEGRVEGGEEHVIVCGVSAVKGCGR